MGEIITFPSIKVNPKHSDTDWISGFVWDAYNYGDIDFQPLDELEMRHGDVTDFLISYQVEKGLSQVELKAVIELMEPLQRWLNWYSDFPSMAKVPAWGWSYWIHGWVPRKYWGDQFEDPVHLRKLLEITKAWLVASKEKGRLSSTRSFDSAYKKIYGTGKGDLGSVPSPPPKPHDIEGTVFRPDGITVNAFYFDLVLICVAYTRFDDNMNKVIKALKGNLSEIPSAKEKLSWAQELKKLMDDDFLSRTVIQQRDLDHKDVKTTWRWFYEKELPPIALKIVKERRLSHRR